MEDLVVDIDGNVNVEPVEIVGLGVDFRDSDGTKSVAEFVSDVEGEDIGFVVDFDKVAEVKDSVRVVGVVSSSEPEGEAEGVQRSVVDDGGNSYVLGGFVELSDVVQVPSSSANNR